jgi:cell division protein FtsI (penicillin-binding protein 3)
MVPKSHKMFVTRLGIVLGCVLLWGSLISYRLFSLQVWQHEEMAEKARRQRSRTYEVSPRRGTIYDRRHRELAISIQVDSIFAVPSEIPDKKGTSEQLAVVLGLKSADLQKKMFQSRHFVWIKRKADYGETVQVKQLNLPGIYFEKESKRFYPKRELASHVLGYVGMDNEGLNGVEAYYDRLIKGHPGLMQLMADGQQRSYSSVGKLPTAGEDLVLTIDEYIQFVVEQELALQVSKSQAIGGTAIVMDPRNGEILALANYPSFNPNLYKQYSPPHLNNRAIWTVYEPGSTFKIITAGTVLNEKLARPNEVIFCNQGSITIGKHQIHDHKPYGALTVSEVVANSSNVGAVKLGMRLSPEKFYEYIRQFGFGSPTSVDLPREEAGLVRDWKTWPTITHATISMGQGIGVTPLQILKAISIVANGGKAVHPHLLLPEQPGILARTAYHPDSAPTQVLRVSTTALLRGMMRDVVTEGTGKSAQLEGFSAAGKTGTAQKAEGGHYSHSKFVASFVGFAPLENPVIAVAVAIDEPKGLYYGAEVAAPVFRGIADKVLRYQSVAPDQPLTENQLTQLRKRQEDQAIKDSDLGLQPVEGDSNLVSTTRMVSEEEEVPLKDKDPMPLEGSLLNLNSGLPPVEVPDLAGKSMRTALAAVAQLGLELNASGSGMAVQQIPAPHTRVVQGSKITVRFSRRLN